MKYIMSSFRSSCVMVSLAASSWRQARMRLPCFFFSILGLGPDLNAGDGAEKLRKKLKFQ